MKRKILVIVLRAIGDVLLTTPLVRAIKKNMPGSSVYFLTGPASAKMLKYNRYLDGVLVHGRGASEKIKKEKFDVAMDFMNSALSGYYSLLSGAKKRAAFYRPWGFWCHNVTPRYTPRGYTVLDRLQLLEPLGVEPDGVRLDLNFTGKEAAKADLFLKESGAQGSRGIITLDITNRREHRQWPKEKFCELADALAEEFGAKVIFLWGPGEYNYVKSAVEACRLKHILCGDLDILELAPLLKKSALHVGTSSAPGHIAVSQGTPTFIVYGMKTNPVNWTPPDDRRHGFIQGDFAALGAAEVIAKIKEFAALNGLFGAGKQKA